MREKFFEYAVGWGGIDKFEEEVNTYLESLDKNENVDSYETSYFPLSNRLVCVVTVHYIDGNE